MSQRLILEVPDTDGFTYSGLETYPIICESPEKALLDLEALILENPRGAFVFAGIEFLTRVFYDNKGELQLPEIFTVEEWFASAEG